MLIAFWLQSLFILLFLQLFLFCFNWEQLVQLSFSSIIPVTLETTFAQSPTLWANNFSFNSVISLSILFAFYLRLELTLSDCNSSSASSLSRLASSSILFALSYLYCTSFLVLIASWSDDCLCHSVHLSDYCSDHLLLLRLSFVSIAEILFASVLYDQGMLYNDLILPV